MNRKFAIITSFYNVEPYIDACIQSVINQTYRNWIWIVSDDGSSDNTKEILLKYCSENSNIIYYEQKYKSQLMKEPFEFAPKECDYFMFMDSDDRMLPKCLEVYNKVLNDHIDDNICLISCEASWIIDNKRSFPTLMHSYVNQDASQSKPMIGANVWGCLRAIKNKKFLENLLTELEDYKQVPCYCEDSVYYNQSQKYGNILSLKRNLYDFIRRSDSVSIMTKKRKEKTEEQSKIIENFIKTNELIGESVKTWEGELFHDANAMLMGEFNFKNKSSKINLFTKQEKDFSDLYKLYYDHDLKINSRDDNIRYAMINTESFCKEEIIELFNFMKQKNYNQISIYHYNSQNFIDLEELVYLMDNYIGRGRFWCRHGAYSYNMYNKDTKMFYL